MFDENINELTTKLGGVILRKAELENNFDRVYSMVFERMNTMQESEEEMAGDDFLVILGEIGG